MFLVGTHKDVVGDSKVHAGISATLFDRFKGTPVFTDCIQFNKAEDLWFFPVNNAAARTDATIARLQESIESVAHAQEFTTMRIPAPWLACLDSMNARARKDSLQRLALDDVRALAAAFNVVDVYRMLHVFHQLGLLMHFTDLTLTETVVLDPQWIVDSFASIIRDFDLHTMAQDPAVRRMVDAFEDLQQRGVLRRSLV